MVHYMQYLIEAHTLRLSVVGGAGEGKIQIHTLSIQCTMLFNDNSR